MGFAAAGACFPTNSEALANWCAHVEPGDTAMSCSGCDSTASTCSITWQPSGSPSSQTASVPVSTPSCEVPTPVDDALIYTGAIIALWVVVWAARAVYNIFRVPHADSF